MRFSQNIQLLISSLVVILAGLAYGAAPDLAMSYLFGFGVTDLEEKNIFRAVMGLYLAFAGLWIYGIARPAHWRTAAISNLVFMGGLAFGRLISTWLDGFSPQFFVGMLLEFGMFGWGVFNLYKSRKPSQIGNGE